MVKSHLDCNQQAQIRSIFERWFDHTPDTLRLRFGFFTWAPYVKLETKLEYPFIYHSLKRKKDINFLFPICRLKLL